VSPRFFTPRYDGPVDSGPRRDVCRGDAVGRPSEAARHASELVPRRSVLLVHCPARGTGARCVPGVHKDHGNALCLCLVLHEGAQLAEAPREVSSPLGALNRCPLSERRPLSRPQVLSGYSKGQLGLSCSASIPRSSSCSVTDNCGVRATTWGR
jgi:hypothetical protein